jgi:hypothetical protein
MLTGQIIGAPAFFPTVWGWIKKWFDPVTTSKIFILSSSEVKSTLSQYIHPDNIPKRYGGNLDWEFGMLPNIDQDVIEALGERYKTQDGWIRGPIKWVHDTCIAFGSENGVDRREVVAVRPKHTLDDVKSPDEGPKTEAVNPELSEKEPQTEEAVSQSENKGMDDTEKEKLLQEKTVDQKAETPAAEPAVQEDESSQGVPVVKQDVSTQEETAIEGEENDSDTTKFSAANGGAVEPALANGKTKGAVSLTNGSIHKEGVPVINGSA